MMRQKEWMSACYGGSMSKLMMSQELIMSTYSWHAEYAGRGAGWHAPQNGMRRRRRIAASHAPMLACGYFPAASFFLLPACCT